MFEQSLDDFVAEWKPLIRPPGLEEALIATYRLGPNQRFDMARLPLFMADYDLIWLREMGKNLAAHAQIASRIDDDGFARLRRLLDAHRLELRRNRFDARYLGSIEDIALFFLYHEVMPIWVVSCYDRSKNALLDALSRSEALTNGPNALALQKAISTMALIDCTQLHRVYNFYDHNLIARTVRRRLAVTDYAYPDEEGARGGRARGGTAA